MPPSQWDHKADKDLLLAIIDEGALKGIVWPKIAVTLQSKGYTFTHEACRLVHTSLLELLVVIKSLHLLISVASF